MPRSAENRPDRGQSLEAPQLEQPRAPEARVLLAADQEMVVDRDAERFGGLSDLACHLDIRARRGRVSSGRIVHQDYFAVWLPNEAICIRRRFSTKVAYSLE